MPHETAAVSAQVLCTPYNHEPCHFTQSHIRKVHACLAVTCHLHFWQNDRDLLRAIAVTRCWNGYRNESLHRKLTFEQKILPPLLQGFQTRRSCRDSKTATLSVTSSVLWPLNYPRSSIVDTWSTSVCLTARWLNNTVQSWMRDSRLSDWLLVDWITWRMDGQLDDIEYCQILIYLWFAIESVYNSIKD